MVLLQETLASFDGNTALSIGWNLGVVGELFEKRLWNDKNLDFFAKEVLNGALVNRSVSEAQTGSPTRGGRPGTNAVETRWFMGIVGAQNVYNGFSSINLFSNICVD